MEQKTSFWIETYYKKENVQLTWELIKYDVWKLFRVFCKQKAGSRRQAEQRTKLLGDVPSEENESNYMRVKEQVELFEKEKTDGIIIRSKAKWHEEGEKNTKYFLNLEKRNYIKNNMYKFKIDSEAITYQKNILNEQKKFYQNLYCSDNPELNKSIFKTNLPISAKLLKSLVASNWSKICLKLSKWKSFIDSVGS